MDTSNKSQSSTPRRLACAPGMQVTGRVVSVMKSTQGTRIDIDAGREILQITQSPGEPVNIQEGQRIQAKAVSNIEEANQRIRMLTWQFADLELEETRQKGKGRAQPGRAL